MCNTVLVRFVVVSGTLSALLYRGVSYMRCYRGTFKRAGSTLSAYRRHIFLGILNSTTFILQARARVLQFLISRRAIEKGGNIKRVQRYKRNIAN